MLSPRWTKVLNDLSSNKTRTALVVLSIAIGAFAAGMIISSQRLISKDLNGGYLLTNPAHATIYTGEFDDGLVRAVRHIKGVRNVEGRCRIRVKVENGTNMELVTFNDFTRQEVSTVSIDEGVVTPPRGYFAVERGSKLTLPGDAVDIELPDGRHKTLLKSGIFHNAMAAPPIFAGGLEGFISWDTRERLGLSRFMNELHIVFEGESLTKDEISKSVEAVKRHLERNGQKVRGSYIPDPGKHPASFVIDAIMVILGSMGLLSLFLSGFLVVNTITALLIQQTRQIGILKAVGATTAQVAGIYFGMVALLGIFAFAIAVPTSILATQAFTNWTAEMLNYTPSKSGYVPVGVAVQAAVSLLVPLLAAAIPITAGTRVSVREALNFTGISDTHDSHDILSRALTKVKGLHRPFVLALRNTFRRKGRLALTMLTLCLGGAVFAGVMSTRQSLYKTMDEAFEYWNYDVSLNLASKYSTERILREVEKVPGVEAAECWNFKSSRRMTAPDAEGSSFLTVGLPATTEFIIPKLIEGRWLVPEDEVGVVVNTHLTRNETDVRIGSHIDVKYDGDKQVRFKVVGIVRSVMTGPTMYVNQGWFSRFISESGRTWSVNILTNKHDITSQKSAAEAVEEHLRSAGIKVASRDELTGDIKTRIGNQFDMLVVVLVVMALLVSAVGGLGLAGTMSMNVLERTKEIGVMRAIGARDGSVMGIFVLEGVVIGLMSWILGVLCSLPIGRLLSDSVGMNFMQSTLTYTFSAGGALLWLGLSLLLAVLASLLPAWKASSITVRDVLAYEG